MLTRLAQLGINTLIAPVPWGFHEFEKGTIDLTGATASRRNLVGLIELCTAVDFRCLLQLGPYHQQVGILSHGLPAWLPKNASSREAALSAGLTDWYQTLSKALVDHQWPAGPIIALQVDTTATDQQPKYETELTEVKWPIWLRKRYRGIEALNAAYDTAYRSVSEVEFPPQQNLEGTAVEKDARLFLQEVQDDEDEDLNHRLVKMGWQVPLLETEPVGPEDSMRPAEESSDFQPFDPDGSILVFSEPIQVDPDPTDIGAGAVWAAGAPVRTDGSLRKSFWRHRHALWPQTPADDAADQGLGVISESWGALITSGRDTAVKLALPKGVRPVGYRLRINGELIADDALRAFRGKFSGQYLTEDQADQIDFIFYLNEPADPLDGFLLVYLKRLLRAQACTLARCGATAEKLGQMYTAPQQQPEAAQPASSRPKSYTLAEAKRGLREADAALRNAMRSIGGLEMGFDTILGRDKPSMAKPAAPVKISPAIFEGKAKDAITEAGEICTRLAPHLTSAAAALQALIDGSQVVTVDTYQQGYAMACDAANEGRRPLLKLIERLRGEFVTESLPLVMWRVHDQLFALSESLRWGVTRH